MKKLTLLLLLFTLLYASPDTVTVQFYGKLLSQPEANGKLVKILDDGCPVQVISQYDEWLEVHYETHRGWILKTQTTYDESMNAPSKKRGKKSSGAIDKRATKKVTKQPLPKKEDEPLKSAGNGDDHSDFSKEYGVEEGGNFIPFLLLGGFVIIVIAGTVVVISKHKPESTLVENIVENSAVNKQTESVVTVLIFSNEDTLLDTVCNGKQVPLSRILRELGFKVFFSTKLKKASIEPEFKPNLIMVNNHFEQDSITNVKKLIEQQSWNQKTPFIIYNREDISGAVKETGYKLSPMFDETELYVAVTSAIEHYVMHKKEPIRGVITGEGLEGLFIFLEIGEYSGMLQLKNRQKRLVGEVGFDTGKILYAKSAQHIGEEAAKNLSMINDGHFVLRDAKLPQDNCFVSAEKMLREMYPEGE